MAAALPAASRQTTLCRRQRSGATRCAGRCVWAWLALTDAEETRFGCHRFTGPQYRSMLHDADFKPLDSMWSLAAVKLAVYRENREILLSILQRELGAHSQHFTWTTPQAGFFSVFSFHNPSVRTDDEFIQSMVADFGIVVIPMYDFYPEDAKQRDPNVGLNQLRLSFCFSESTGAARRRDLTEAVEAFCQAAKSVSGLD